MTRLTTLIPLVLQASMVLTMAGLGLRTRPGDVLALFRDGRRPARSLLAMSVGMPLLSVAVAVALRLHPAVVVALAALAVSPVPPRLRGEELKARGGGSCSVGLLFATAALSLVTVPAAVYLASAAAGEPRHLAPLAVAMLVGASVVAPLAAGAVIRRMAPLFARRAAAPVGAVGALLLMAACIAVMAAAFPRLVSLLDNGTLTASVLLVAAGLIAGHLLGGRRAEDRVGLALSTAARHPGVAAAAAAVIAPGELLVLAAVLLYSLLGMLGGALYVHRHHPAPADSPGTLPHRPPARRTSRTLAPRRRSTCPPYGDFPPRADGPSCGSG